MQLAYEAANAAQAHIIKDLLDRAGFNAVILGEYLQGGVGELPAAGYIRVMVQEGDYVQAKAIIQLWESAEWDENAWQNEAN